MRHKRVNIVSFHLYEVSRKGRFIQNTIEVTYRGLGEGEWGYCLISTDFLYEMKSSENG